MYSETIDHEPLNLPALPDGMTWKLSASYDHEAPNSVYGIWEDAGGHTAGTTVQDCHGMTGYWVSCNYTPAQLAADYAKQGRSNPSRDAYESLQNELYHYLYGDMLTVCLAIVANDGTELAADYIGTDYSDWAYPDSPKEDCAIDCAREYFCPESLIEAAQTEVAALVQRYTLKADQYRQLSSN